MTCCEACHTPVNFIARKKCSTCGRSHCTRCLLTVQPSTDTASSPVARWVAKNIGSSRRVCVKCAMLSAGDYTRDDLHSRYSAREIRAFLIKRQIVVDGCKEKSDLIELAMSISRAPDARRDDDLEHRRRVAQMKEKLRNEMSDQSSGESPARPSHQSSTTPADNVSSTGTGRQTNAGSRIQSEINNGIRPDATSGGQGVFISSEFRSSSSSQEPEEFRNYFGDDERRFDNSNNARTINTDTASQEQPPTEVDVNDDGASLRQRVSLDDIASADAVDSLTVRQLKELLINSFVDYKGCCERGELIDHVRRLWTEHQRNKKLVSDAEGESSESSKTFLDENLCKVCADAAIDCVLLECGHMVTCTACGKRLAECPICRRYVSRVVHVFRA